jgi:predicted PurR-regulated permease PerM
MKTSGVSLTRREADRGARRWPAYPLSIETLWLAFVTAGVYVLIHVVEGETITPMLLAKRFTINPVLVILALVFWYWMWGILGAILAVPMLAITKIICDRVQPLAAFGHFIEG